MKDLFKKSLSGWYFIGVYTINRKLHGRLEIRHLSSSVEEYFTRLLRSFVKYFSTLEDKCGITARPRNILYMLPVVSYELFLQYAALSQINYIWQVFEVTDRAGMIDDAFNLAR